MHKSINKLVLTTSALAASVLIVGCGTLEPAVPEAEPQIQAEWPLPATTESSDAGDRAVADIGWRDFFVDPKLEELIGRALDNNRDLRVAVLNVERARNLYRIQSAARTPSVGATGSATRSGGDGLPPTMPRESYRAEIGITEFELDLFGRVRNLSDAALQQYFATEEARRSAQLTLIAEVANAYLTLITDQELQRIAFSMLDTFESEFELTEERHRLGAASSLELAQARTIVQQARSDVARFAGQIAQDRNALALLVGSPIESSLLPEEFDLEVSGLADLPIGLPSHVLLRRPDVLQAELQLRAANANIGAARAAFFPSISLTGAVGTASNELSELFSSGTDMWSFAPRLNVPIFQGGRLRANREVAIAERDIALAQYERSIQSGFREVADALALSRTLDEQLEAQEGLLEAASEAHELSQARYQAGQDSYFVLLDAQRTLYSARQSLVRTQLAEQANRSDLYRALGGGWVERSD